MVAMMIISLCCRSLTCFQSMDGARFWVSGGDPICLPSRPDFVLLHDLYLGPCLRDCTWVHAGSIRYEHYGRERWVPAVELGVCVPWTLGWHQTQLLCGVPELVTEVGVCQADQGACALFEVEPVQVRDAELRGHVLHMRARG